MGKSTKGNGEGGARAGRSRDGGKEVSAETKKQNAIKRLEEIGQVWEKNPDRIYFNNLDKRLGIEAQFNKSGSVSSAKLNGEKISNNKASNLIMEARLTKIYYSKSENKFIGKTGLSDADYNRIVNSIKKEAGIE